MKKPRTTAVLPLLAILLAAAHDAAATTTTTTTTTSSSTSTSNSYPPTTYVEQHYSNTILLGVFPQAPIASITIHVQVYTAAYDDTDCAIVGPAGDYAGFRGEKTVTFQSLPGGSLTRSQALVYCATSTEEPLGPLSPSDYQATVEARNADGEVVPTSLCVVGYDPYYLNLPTPNECLSACGDAVCDGGDVKVADALAVLRSAVGLSVCSTTLCDASRDGNVGVGDALLVLRRSVGLPQSLLCKPAGVCLTAPVP